jgi:16S rRNA processing protein RimM
MGGASEVSVSKLTVAREAESLDGTIRMGRVARAHGVTGELEVRPDWAESRGLLEAREVVLEAESGALERHAVRGKRLTPKGVLLALDGITDRDQAEARRGYAVHVPREALPRLADGEYYLCDLVGARVTSPEGPVGTVVEVQMYPSVDAVVIEAADGARFEQPLLDQWLARVDVTAREVALASRDGLIEVPRARGATPAD